MFWDDRSVNLITSSAAEGIMAKKMNTKQATERFAETLRKGCKSADAVNVWDVWIEFKEYCAIPIDNNGEGFVFDAGFKSTFSAPDFNRVADYSRYDVTFNRYWYDESGSHATECRIEFPGHPSLRKHEAISFEECPLKDFVDKVESMKEFWDLLRSMRGRYSNSCEVPNPS
jgi:hypothetical protein